MQSDIGLKRHKDILNLPDLLINQHHVPSNIAEVIAFAKIRANGILTDNRLIMYILEATKYGTKEQVTSAFIQEVFQHMESTKHPLFEDLLHYEVGQIKFTASIISKIQEILWRHLLDACDFTTTHERAISQLIIQYVYGDQRNLSELLRRLTKQHVSNDLLVALVEHQKDFAMDLYTAITQPGISNDWWIRDQADIMGR